MIDDLLINALMTRGKQRYVMVATQGSVEVEQPRLSTIGWRNECGEEAENQNSFHVSATIFTG
ncbi:MAG: hypothetical protein KAY68_00120 [Azonexus sp.]|nr:hypothetical protein [Azonexus sp.]